MSNLSLRSNHHRSGPCLESLCEADLVGAGSQVKLRLLFAAAAACALTIGCSAMAPPAKDVAVHLELPKPPIAVLVITAVDYEYANVASTLSGARSSVIGDRQLTAGTIDGASVVVMRAGWGKANAAGAAALGLKTWQPSVLVMAGISGGLDADSVQTGDIVVATSTFQHDVGTQTAKGDFVRWPAETPQEKEVASPSFASDARLSAAAVEAISALQYPRWSLPSPCECEKDGTRKAKCTGPEPLLGREQPKTCRGVMATGDAFVADPKLAATLVQKNVAVSVDMETAAVAEEGRNFGVPFVGVRVIADSVSSPGGETFYYCLKPQSGPRLRLAMNAVLHRLVAELAPAAGAARAAAPAGLVCRDEKRGANGMRVRPVRGAKLHAVRIH